jgi:hypothetical protein
MAIRDYRGGDGSKGSRENPEKERPSKRETSLMAKKKQTGF